MRKGDDSGTVIREKACESDWYMVILHGKFQPLGILVKSHFQSYLNNAGTTNPIT